MTEVYKELIEAIQNLEDALMQGRELDVYLLVNVDGEETVDVSITEHITGRDTKRVFSELGYATVEEAIIAVGNNL